MISGTAAILMSGADVLGPWLGSSTAWAAILVAVVIVQRPDPRADAGRSVVRSSGGTALR